MKIISTLLLVIFLLYNLKGQYYVTGDTLNVVALNEVNLREAPRSKGVKISVLQNGEKVIVLHATECIQDSIDGFGGCWIKIRSVTNGKEGYAFDSYLSRFPVLTELESIKDYISGKYRWDEAEHYDYMPIILEEYATKVFPNNGCKGSYFNGIDGESYHHFEIANLTKEVSFIKHGYWEGSATELEFTNCRVSEIYYLILNLIKFLPPGLSELNEDRVKNPQYGMACIGTGDNLCIIEIMRKSENTISIFFVDTCC